MRSVQGGNETSRSLIVIAIWPSRFSRRSRRRSCISSATLSKRHPSRNLCLTGGVALNCVANARILRDTDYRSVWVPPCASDSGAPFGSALWHYHQTLGHPRALRADPCFPRQRI